MSTAPIPLTFAQKNANSVESNEKLNYTHHKTMVNGFNMHYVIGGKGDPVAAWIRRRPRADHGWSRRSRERRPGAPSRRRCE